MLTANFTSFHHLHEKLLRDHDRLTDEVTGDAFFDFTVTGYSLIDWVKKDPAVPLAASSSVTELYEDRWLKVCGDIATGMKHFTLEKRTPITASVHEAQGYGIGRFGKGAFGVGESDIVVDLKSGQSLGCLELADGVVQTWAAFIQRHGL
jgi:hypothetical protein